MEAFESCSSQMLRHGKHAPSVEGQNRLSSELRLIGLMAEVAVHKDYL